MDAERSPEEFNITYVQPGQIKVIVLKKTYTLNPLAKEFVPRAMQKEALLTLSEINSVHP
jgi:Ataxin-2 C-terminal region